jgi:hypothetical protein
MWETHTICLVFGAILLGIGLIGGGISIKDFSIPKVPWFSRFISFALGACLMLLGLSMSPAMVNSSTSPAPVAPPSPAPVETSPPVALPTAPVSSANPVASPSPVPVESAAPLAGIAGNQPATQASSDEAYQASVIEQLESVSEQIGLGGYELIDAYGDQLEDNASNVLPLILEEGVSYAIVGVCDKDCGDIDLALYDENDSQVSLDEERDAYPIVEVTPQWTGDFNLKVDMPNCPASYCYYGIGLFQG